ncbi:MAG: DUF1307 domain-containing protein [Parvimonas sp.]|uniref:DUF1307 domain-containing protein n=1 Tax=Parvimonas sp. TaxID=1944660 RepID=UPI0025D31C48|nr:DUF1307 domain-containing protein [Parvimonas sp.]MCI5997097.1 YehR family protein [Parvimonas sp.]MDY3051266.1 DUF1307 domain-containing protein [Parvimonas sp.]
MKDLRKIFKNFALVLSIICLVACSGGSKKTFIKEENGKKETMVVEYKGEDVKTVTMKMSEDFESLGVKTKAEAEAFVPMVEAMVKQLGDGITVKTNVSEKDVEITFTIDVAKVDPSKFKDGSFIEAKDVEEMKKMATLEKSLTEQGYKESK